MFKPLYLVTQFKNVQKQSRANKFTGGHDKEDRWKVGMIHGYFPGVGLNFFYETEPQASEFSLWQIYDQEGIIDKSGIVESVVCQGYEPFQMPMMPSWGDFPFLQTAWRVSFDWSQGSLELWDSQEFAVSRFADGQVYTMLDLFGTLPASPFDLQDELEARAAQAKSAQDEADRATEAAARAKEESDQARKSEAARAAFEKKAIDKATGQLVPGIGKPLTLAQKEQQAAAAAAASAKANADYLAFYNSPAQVALRAAQQAAAAKAAAAQARQAAYNSVWHPTGRPVQDSDGWFWVANGGATGYYDGTFFANGTFGYASEGKSGNWFGTYSPGKGATYHPEGNYWS